MENRIYMAMDAAEAAKLIHVLTAHIDDLELKLDTQKSMLEDYAKKISELEKAKEDDF